MLHVILGSGPVGCWTARALVEKGHAVRVVNRSGRRPDLLPDAAEVVAADVRDVRQAIEVSEGTASVLQMLGVPYASWERDLPALQAGALAAAEAHGARYLSFENLYMYEAVGELHEESRIAPPGRKGALRQRLAEGVQAAHASGRVRATTLRAADLYGPGVTQSLFGERFFAPLLAGKGAQWIGDADVPHAAAYAPDVGRAAAELVTYESSLGKLWFAPHAPAITPEAWATLAASVANVEAKVRAMGPWTLRLGAAFRRDAREMVELLPNLTRPYLVSSKRIDAVYGLRATPPSEGVPATVAWFEQRRASPAG